MIGTRVKTFVSGLKWIDETVGYSDSELLLRTVREADEAVAELGDVEIVEIHDALYSLPDKLDTDVPVHNYPVFTRRIVYRPA